MTTTARSHSRPQTAMVELSAGASIAVRPPPPHRQTYYITCPNVYGTDNSVQLGVIVGLASTCIQSIGLTLQRKSHLLEEEKDDDYERRPPYKRRRWQVRILYIYGYTFKEQDPDSHSAGYAHVRRGESSGEYDPDHNSTTACAFYVAGCMCTTSTSFLF